MNIKLRKTDVIFSKIIRTRDKWKCQRCKKQYAPGMAGLQNSHFWGRGRENTRFDPDNCDALCFFCHQLWGGDLRGDYETFKREQLGEDKFRKLKLRAFTYKKKDDKLMMFALKELDKQYDRTRNKRIT